MTESTDTTGQREAARVQEKGSIDPFMYAVATITVVGFFALIAILLFRGLPEINNNIVMLLMGALTAEVGKIYNFLFGSSKSSADKTRMLSASQPKRGDA